MSETPRRGRVGRLRHRGHPDDLTPRRAAADERAHLSPVSGRPPLREYLRQIVERRHFITLQAWSQSTTQHRGMLLGNLWLIVGPALDGLVYFLIFGVIMQVSRGMHNFFGYLVIGVFMFSFTTRCVSLATTAIQSNRGLIRAFTFPRAVLPVAGVLRETMSMAPVLLALSVLLVLVPPGAHPNRYWLLVPIVFGLQACFNLGVAFMVARLGAVVPDARQLIPYFTRLWMYGSAVMFTIDRFDRIPMMGEIVRANPMYTMLDTYRLLLLESQMPPVESWTTLTIWALGALLFGTVFFWQKEVFYGRSQQ